MTYGILDHLEFQMMRPAARCDRRFYASKFRMARLFVAIDLPMPVTQALAGLQPQVSAKMRVTNADQMHVTLHYIGEADSSRIAAALSAVRAPKLSLSIKGVGQFRSPDGAVTLWAGIEKCAGLLQLHDNVGKALLVEGYRPETRLYTPHVTLARCTPAPPASMIDEFLLRHADFALPEIEIRGFGLYSSELVASVPTYRREESFPRMPLDRGAPAT